MVYKKLIAIFVFSFFLIGCLDVDDFEFDDSDIDGFDNGYEGEGSGVINLLDTGSPFDAFEEKLLSEGFSVKKAVIAEDMSIIKYTQSADVKPEEIYANWTYILGQSVRLAPANSNIERNFIITEFDNGETVLIGATTNTIRLFLEGEMDTWTFMYYVNFIPVTKGQQIWDGT